MSRLRSLHIAIILFATLACVFASCVSSSETGMVKVVRARVQEQLAGDTSQVVQSALAVIDTLPCRNEEETARMYSVINKLLFNMHHAGDGSKTVKLTRGILDILERETNPRPADKREQLNLYIILGTSFSESGMPSVSLDYYTKGLELCTDSADMQYKGMYYNNIGVLYADANMLDKAAEYFEKALEINLQAKIHHEAYLNYANLAELYALQGNLDEAQNAAQHSLDHLNGNDYPLLLANMRMQQGDIYTQQKQYDVAMLRYLTALKQYRASNFISGVIETRIHQSQLYLHRNLPDSALFYAKEALNQARSTNQPEFVAQALGQMSEVMEVCGENREAVKYLKESVALSDSLRKTETQLRLNNWEVLGPDLFAGSPKNGVEARTWHIVGGIFISLILLSALIYAAILLLRLKRLKKEKADELDQKNAELDQSNRELTSLSLKNIKVTEGIEGVCDELRSVLLELNPRETAKRERIRQLLGKLDNLSGDNGDEEFKNFFERVHPDFYKMLSERWPDLTQRDLRLCAFIYLGMNTKEIATLTYREVRSVESARNRLRKKLGIENADDLQSFLQELYSAPAS